MADIYSALMGLPTEQDQMQALAQRLRRRSDLATIGVLSGDPVLSQWGAGELERAQEQARSLKPSPMSLGLGVVSRGARDPEAQALYEKRAREGRAFKKTLASLKAQKAVEAAEYKRNVMPESTWKGLSTALNWVDTLARQVPQIQALKDIAQPKADVAASLAKKAGLEDVARLVEPTYRGEEARSVRNIIKNVINKLRAGDFGAALTRYEGGEFGDVDPLAPGLTVEAMVQRVKNMVAFLRDEAVLKISGRRVPGNAPLPSWLTDGFSWEQPEDTRAGEKETTSAAEVPAPTYARSLIPKGTRITTDPDTGKEVAVDPTTGRMWELD